MDTTKSKINPTSFEQTSALNLRCVSCSEASRAEPTSSFKQHSGPLCVHPRYNAPVPPPDGEAESATKVRAKRPDLPQETKKTPLGPVRGTCEDFRGRHPLHR